MEQFVLINSENEIDPSNIFGKNKTGVDVPEITHQRLSLPAQLIVRY
jgi:hypothetical protein